MKVSRLDEESQVRFVVTDADPSLHQALTALGFGQSPEGFWRRFSADAAHLDEAFARLEVSLEPMVRQVAAIDPVPWEDALSRFIELVNPSTIDWWLVGSAALAVRGIRVDPGDLDVVVPEPAFPDVVERLRDYLVEPPSRNDGWVARWFCRAFIGARVEWIAGVREPADTNPPSEFGPAAEAEREIVQWRGASLRVPPLQMQLAVCERRGLAERIARIDEFVSASG